MLISILKSVPILFPFVTGIINHKHLDKGLNFIFLQICFWVFSEALSRIIRFSGHENVWFLHIYVPIEFLIFAFAYACFLKNLIKPKFIYIVAIVFISFSVMNTLFIQSIHSFNSYVRAIGALFYIIFAILYFYKLLFELKVQKILKEPVVWINTGILVYFSASFFLDILSNKLIQYSMDLAYALMYIRPIFFGIFCILAGIGFLISKKSVINKG